jgi:dTDP-4-dehydrorhamnose reductase
VGLALGALMPRARLLAHGDLDVTDRAAVSSAAEGADAIIHLAALTNVDGCEQDPARAFAVNAEGTRNVVEAAARHGARVIYISTDYVFDGAKRGEYAEEDPVGPVNAYGRTKLMGEGLVAGLPGSLIVRTSWVFGEGRNFIRTIIGAAQRRGPLKVVHDQTGRPTSAHDLAAALVVLVDEDASGILHVTGDGDPCTWADLAEFAIDAAGLSVPVERIDSPTHQRTAGRLVAPRPRNSVLALGKAKTAGVPLRSWRPSVEGFVRALA